MESERMQNLYNKTYEKICTLNDEYVNVINKLIELKDLTRTIENEFVNEYNEIVDMEEDITTSEEETDDDSLIDDIRQIASRAV